MTAQPDILAVAHAPRAARRRPLRVALLTNENAPYRIPLYRELASTPTWAFHVFTCIDREFDRLWEVTEPTGFTTKKSFSLKYMRHQRFGDGQSCIIDKEVHLPIGVVPDLIKYRPDVVLTNEFGARTLFAAMTAKLTGHRLIVYSEATCHTEAYIGRGQKWLRNLLRKRADAYICNGLQSREYLEALGVTAADVFEVGQAIDLESFDRREDLFDRDMLRRRWGISGVCYLYAGQLVKFKGSDNLIQAWIAFCRDQGADATLLLAGEGKDHRFLEAEVARAGLNNVRFLGFVPRQELPDVYAAADVFVFPTLRDCFSLAFEEAMASGLPVIGSIYGGESELVKEGVNGWVCDPLDHDDLVEKLQLACRAQHELPAMGARARDVVSRMDIDKVAERIRHAVDYVLTKPNRRTRSGR